MAMDQFLAEYYGTAQGASAQDGNEKTAQVELFAKLAAAEGIDLNAMSDGQVEQLFNATFDKTASDDEESDAAAELEEKQSASAKFAEADYMGRVMAHSYVQEMRKIAEESGLDKEAGPVWEGVKGHGRAATNQAAALVAHVRGKGTHLGLRKATEAVKSKGRAVGAHLQEHRGKYLGGVAAAGTAGGAAGGYAAGKKKKASAIDNLAAPLAVEKAAAAGWNLEQAAELVSELVLSGASDANSKVAAAANVNQAVEIRASELLEQAGYPVDWS